MATAGSSPALQYRQAFFPASSPLMFNGWNGPGTFSPVCGPDLMSAANATAPRAPTTAAANRLRIIDFSPWDVSHKSTPVSPAPVRRYGANAYSARSLAACGLAIGSTAPPPPDFQQISANPFAPPPIVAHRTIVYKS